jgi:predicted phage tail protein
MRNAPYGQNNRSEGDIYRSTRYFVGATRVNAAVSAVIGGLMFLGISLFMPSWAGGINGIVALMGLGLILTGVAYWFLGQD